MPETNFHQPDLGPLRAVAEAAELAQAATGLASAYRYRLADCDPIAQPARDIARPMAVAGLTVHRCAPHDPRCRPGRGGIAVSRTTHSLLSPDCAEYGPRTGTQQAMNTAIGGILRAFGYAIALSGSAGAWLATGRHRQETEAGR